MALEEEEEVVEAVAEAALALEEEEVEEEDLLEVLIEEDLEAEEEDNHLGVFFYLMIFAWLNAKIKKIWRFFEIRNFFHRNLNFVFFFEFFKGMKKVWNGV